MSVVRCPSCGSAIQVPEKSGFPWIAGCAIAVAVLFVVVAVVGLLAAIAIPSFIKARQAAQTTACVHSMRQISAAKQTWASNSGAVAGQAVDPAVIDQALSGPVPPACLAGGTYTYGNVGQDPACSVHGTLSNAQAYRNSSRMNSHPTRAIPAEPAPER